MMEVWNSHGKWEVPKPYLIGGSADPMLVCIGDAQILTFLTLGMDGYGRWGVPKPYLIGGSAGAELPVCSKAKPRLKQMRIMNYVKYKSDSGNEDHGK